MANQVTYIVNGRKVDQLPPATEAQKAEFARMLASHSPPRILTDDVKVGHMPTVSDMFDRDPHGTAHICETAVRRGYKPQPHDIYFPELAHGLGDPAAFESHAVGGHTKRVKQSRNETLLDEDGKVITKRHEPESDPYEKPKYRLHPRITSRIKAKMIQDNPDLARADQAELEESIIDKHGAKVD